VLLDPDYCVMMARYNAWQNTQLRKLFEGLSEEALRKNRKAFFGSIFETANHLLWGDMMWMSRFDGGAAPELSGAQSVEITPTPAVWAGERYRMDARILRWAEALHAVDLYGDLTWYSGIAGREMSGPMGMCVTHFFNHQTHHRGQIHAMLTAAGSEAPVTDLAFMPKTGPWL
jgi:uncharacterized damage-inducible protein DinB